jgi:tetratricopeptide (TPR) repeat protein
MKVGNQLRLIVLLIAACLIATITIHSLLSQKMSDDWVERVRLDMIEKEKTTLAIRTGDRANLSRLQFSKSIYNLEMFLTFSEWTSNVGFDFNYPLYYNVPPIGTAPGPLAPTDKDERHHNSDHSGWFKKNITSGAIKTAYEGTLGITELSNLDTPANAMYIADPNYLNIYFGLESNGHYQTMPYTETNFHTATFNPYPSGPVVTGYDPRIRMWYYEAFHNNTKTILTPPYNDALTGKVLITMARYVNTSYPGEGVYGLDIYLDELAVMITGSTILQNGEFYIASANGHAVLYKGIDLDVVKSFDDILLDNENDRNAFASTWAEIISNDMYNGTFIKNGETWYIVSEKVIPDDIVNNGGLLKNIDVSNVDIPYIIIAAVPQSDIEKASTDIKDRADKNNTVALIVNIIILLIVIPVLLYIFYILAIRFTKPVRELEKMTNKLANNNLDLDLEELEGDGFASSKEITQTAKAMQNMYKLMRGGNIAYWMGDMNAALIAYADIRQLVETMSGDKTRMVGSLDNNEGTAHHQLGQIGEASQKYQAAIKNAEVILAEESKKNDNETKIRKAREVVMNRKMNMSNLGVDAIKEKMNGINPSNVKADIEEVLLMATQMENLISQAKVMAIMGRFYTVMGDHKSAFEQYVNGYNTIENAQRMKSDAASKQPYCLDYATYNLAEYYYNDGERTGTRDQYESSMYYLNQFNERNRTATSIPKALAEDFLRLQCVVARKLGFEQIATNIESVLGTSVSSTGSASSGPQYFDLNIDVSGSMGFPTGKNPRRFKIKAVAKSLAMISNNIIKEGDMVSITSFSHNVIPMTNGFESKSVVSRILTQPEYNWNCDGGTALWLTMIDSLTRINNQQFNNPTAPTVNLLVLTDGADGTDPRDQARDINRVDNLIRSCRVNMIIFTIGNDAKTNRTTANALQRFVASAQQTPGCVGHHLTAGESTAEIETQFKAAMKLMGSGRLNVEALC